MNLTCQEGVKPARWTPAGEAALTLLGIADGLLDSTQWELRDVWEP